MQSDGVMLLELGDVNVSVAAAMELEYCDVSQAIGRHTRGEWGELDSRDWSWNNIAVANGHPVVSLHVDRNLKRFLVITSADRQETVVLLPHEY